MRIIPSVLENLGEAGDIDIPELLMVNFLEHAARFQIFVLVYLLGGVGDAAVFYAQYFYYFLRCMT